MQLETFLENSARRLPEKTALVCGSQRISYAELERSANRLAHGLISLGVRRGDRVAIHMENSVEAVTAMFAVLKAGAVFLIVNPTTKTNKLAYILNNCRAKALIVPGMRLARHKGLRAQTPDLQSIIVTGKKHDDGAHQFVEYDHIIAENPRHKTPPEKTAIDVDLAALVYTSGSTGNPKGVMLTHRNMVAAATSITCRRGRSGRWSGSSGGVC